MNIHISSRFGKRGQCGSCKHFGYLGGNTGVCCENDYEEVVTFQDCKTGKYEIYEDKADEVTGNIYENTELLEGEE